MLLLAEASPIHLLLTPIPPLAEAPTGFFEYINSETCLHPVWKPYTPLQPCLCWGKGFSFRPQTIQPVQKKQLAAQKTSMSWATAACVTREPSSSPVFPNWRTRLATDVWQALGGNSTSRTWFINYSNCYSWPWSAPPGFKVVSSLQIYKLALGLLSRPCSFSRSDFNYSTGTSEKGKWGEYVAMIHL